MNGDQAINHLDPTRSDIAKALLSSSVPDVDFEPAARNVHCLLLEVDTRRGNDVGIKVVLTELSHDAAFSDA